VFPSTVYHQIFNAIKIAKSSRVLFEIFAQCNNPVFEKDRLSYQNRITRCTAACIKIAQQDIYAQEICDLSKKGQVSLKSHLQPLHPFLDKEGYLRVGGRLQHSHLPYNSKHQLILPPYRTDYNK